MKRVSRVEVLDKGFVRLVDKMGSDLSVVNAARVSFHKESEWQKVGEEQFWDADTRSIEIRPEYDLFEKDKKLIDYLARHKHWTPFAHTSLTLHIKAPIPIRAQFAKHTVGLVMNEVSRRYVVDEPEIYEPIWRGKPTDGAKQGSADFVNDEDVYDKCCRLYDKLAAESLATYNELLTLGIAPEQARFSLIQGMYTEWWWTGSLAAFARVYGLRVDPHAQWEIRQYGEAIGKIVEPLYPISWKALTSK